jgi:hypothetical protein
VTLLYKKQLAEQQLRRAKYRLHKIVAAARVILFAAHGRVAGCVRLKEEVEKACRFLEGRNR